MTGALAYQGEQGLAEPSRFLESLCGQHGGHPVLAATEGGKRPHQSDPPLLAGVEPVVAQGQQAAPPPFRGLPCLASSTASARATRCPASFGSALTRARYSWARAV